MGQNRTYTTEFKESSAKLAANSDQPISKTARDLGISVTTLIGWVKKYFPNYNKTSKNGKDSASDELLLLRKENARLRQERDILKKAAAYFANETL